MKAIPTIIENCFVIEVDLFGDERGFFFEAFNAKDFENQTGISSFFVQDNQSKSKKNVLRGLHMQKPPHAQAKLVRVLEGEVLDVVVDARKDSPSYGKHFSIKLSAENNKQLYIPRGCLHGFSVLSEEAVFFYKCDNYYNKSAEDGINPLDADLAIDWGIPLDKVLLSDKDKIAQKFSELQSPSF